MSSVALSPIRSDILRAGSNVVLGSPATPHWDLVAQPRALPAGFPFDPGWNLLCFSLFKGMFPFDPGGEQYFAAILLLALGPGLVSWVWLKSWLQRGLLLVLAC